MSCIVKWLFWPVLRLMQLYDAAMQNDLAKIENEYKAAYLRIWIPHYMDCHKMSTEDAFKAALAKYEKAKALEDIIKEECYG